MTKQAVQFWAKGTNRPHLFYALKIEQLSEGKVRASQLVNELDKKVLEILRQTR